jgi:LysM repeat protein
MSTPSPARWIAPAALLAAILAVALVYSTSTGDGERDSSSPPASSETERQRSSTTPRTTRTEPPATTPTTTTAGGTYEVQTGDTLGSIAAENGTTVEDLEEANPGVDSSSLSVGQEIKLP